MPPTKSAAFTVASSTHRHNTRSSNKDNKTDNSSTVNTSITNSAIGSNNTVVTSAFSNSNITTSSHITTTSSASTTFTSSASSYCNTNTTSIYSAPISSSLDTSVTSSPICSHHRSSNGSVLSNAFLPASVATASADKKLNNILNSTPSSIEDSSSLLKLLNDKLEQLQLNIQKQITDVNVIVSQLVANYSVLENKLAKRFEDIDYRLNFIETKMHMDEMILDGIPSIEKEDLQSIFSKICLFLNIKIQSLNFIFRTKSNNSINDGSIIVKFNSVSDKINFSKAYRMVIKNKGTLKLSDIGFNSDKKIFIHEHLSKFNYQLFRHALKLKKGKIIHATFTSNGKIFIVKKKGEIPILIKCFDDFAAYTGNNNDK